MPERYRLPGMRVVVMPVIMAMHMNVLHRLVLVVVGMLVVHQ